MNILECKCGCHKDRHESERTKCLPTCAHTESSSEDIPTFIESKLAAFDAKFKCIQTDCDGHGNIPYQNGEGEWETNQCQFHAEYLFPIKEYISSSIDKAVEAREKEILEEIDKKKNQFMNYKGCTGLSEDTWCCAKHKFANTAFSSIAEFISKK